MIAAVSPPCLASVDPRSLSAAQRRAIRLIKTGAALYRARNRFGHPGKSVSLDVAHSLRGLGLVSTPIGKPLELTYNGKLMAGILEQRASSVGRHSDAVKP